MMRHRVLYRLVVCVLVLVATIAGVEAGDFEESLRYQAERGDACMQYYLGRMYADGGLVGRRVPQDDERAAWWFRQAAEQGYAEAQHSLGDMYATARGVPQDDAEAVNWYRKAAEQGLAEALVALGQMYATGRGVPEDDVQAILLYRKAAKDGDSSAQLALSKAYEGGEGVPQDPVQAYAWFIVAEAPTSWFVVFPEYKAQSENDKKRIAEFMSSAEIAAAQKLACRYWASYRPYMERYYEAMRGTRCPFVVNPPGR